MRIKLPICLFCFSILTSCNWEENVTTPGLGVYPKKDSISLRGGMVELSVKSNSDWTAHSEDWIRVFPDSGTGDMNIIAVVDKTDTERDGSIQFTLPDGKIAEALIHQSAEAEFIDFTGYWISREDYLSHKRYYTPASNFGSVSYICVISNSPWIASWKEDWVTVSPAKSNKYKTHVSITVAPYDTSKTSYLSRRSCYLYFKLDRGLVDSIRVHQYYR